MLTIHQHAKTNLCLFSSGKHTHSGFDMICRQSALCQSRTYLTVCHRRILFPEIIQCTHGFSGFLLLEEADGCIRVNLNASADAWNSAHQRFQQCCLTKTVNTFYRHPHIALQHQMHCFCQRFLIADHQFPCIENHTPRCAVR